MDKEQIESKQNQPFAASLEIQEPGQISQLDLITNQMLVERQKQFLLDLNYNEIEEMDFDILKQPQIESQQIKDVQIQGNQVKIIQIQNSEINRQTKNVQQPQNIIEAAQNNLIDLKELIQSPIQQILQNKQRDLEWNKEHLSQKSQVQNYEQKIVQQMSSQQVQQSNIPHYLVVSQNVQRFQQTINDEFDQINIQSEQIIHNFQVQQNLEQKCENAFKIMAQNLNDKTQENIKEQISYSPNQCEKEQYDDDQNKETCHIAQKRCHQKKQSFHETQSQSQSFGKLQQTKQGGNQQNMLLKEFKNQPYEIRDKYFQKQSQIYRKYILNMQKTLHKQYEKCRLRDNFVPLAFDGQAVLIKGSCQLFEINEKQFCIYLKKQQSSPSQDCQGQTGKRQKFQQSSIQESKIGSKTLQTQFQLLQKSLEPEKNVFQVSEELLIEFENLKREKLENNSAKFRAYLRNIMIHLSNYVDMTDKVQKVFKMNYKQLMAFYSGVVGSKNLIRYETFSYTKPETPYDDDPYGLNGVYENQNQNQNRLTQIQEKEHQNRLGRVYQNQIQDRLSEVYKNRQDQTEINRDYNAQFQVWNNQKSHKINAHQQDNKLNKNQIKINADSEKESYNNYNEQLQQKQSQLRIPQGDRIVVDLVDVQMINEQQFRIQKSTQKSTQKNKQNEPIQQQNSQQNPVQKQHQHDMNIQQLQRVNQDSMLEQNTLQETNQSLNYSQPQATQLVCQSTLQASEICNQDSATPIFGLRQQPSVFSQPVEEQRHVFGQKQQQPIMCQDEQYNKSMLAMYQPLLLNAGSQGQPKQTKLHQSPQKDIIRSQQMPINDVFSQQKLQTYSPAQLKAMVKSYLPPQTNQIYDAFQKLTFEELKSFVRANLNLRNSSKPKQTNSNLLKSNMRTQRQVKQMQNIQSSQQNAVLNVVDKSKQVSPVYNYRQKLAYVNQNQEKKEQIGKKSTKDQSKQTLKLIHNQKISGPRGKFVQKAQKQVIQIVSQDSEQQIQVPTLTTGAKSQHQQRDNSPSTQQRGSFNDKLSPTQHQKQAPNRIHTPILVQKPHQDQNQNQTKKSNKKPQISPSQIRKVLLQTYPNLQQIINAASDAQIMSLCEELIGGKQDDQQNNQQNNLQDNQENNQGNNQQAQEQPQHQQNKQQSRAQQALQPMTQQLQHSNNSIPNPHHTAQGQQSQQQQQNNAITDQQQNNPSPFNNAIQQQQELIPTASDSQYKQDLTFQQLDMIIKTLIQTNSEIKDQITQLSREELLELYREGIKENKRKLGLNRTTKKKGKANAQVIDLQSQQEQHKTQLQQENEHKHHHQHQKSSDEFNPSYQDIINQQQNQNRSKLTQKHKPESAFSYLQLHSSINKKRLQRQAQLKYKRIKNSVSQKIRVNMTLLFAYLEAHDFQKKLDQLLKSKNPKTQQNQSVRQVALVYGSHLGKNGIISGGFEQLIKSSKHRQTTNDNHTFIYTGLKRRLDDMKNSQLEKDVNTEAYLTIQRPRITEQRKNRILELKNIKFNVNNTASATTQPNTTTQPISITQPRIGGSASILPAELQSLQNPSIDPACIIQPYIFRKRYWLMVQQQHSIDPRQSKRLQQEITFDATKKKIKRTLTVQKDNHKIREMIREIARDLETGIQLE